MKTICPSCGHNYDVQTRGKIGTGTRRKIKTVSKNKMMLLGLALEFKEPKSVRQFQGRLFQVKLGNRFQRGDEDQPTGRWNYHHVQAELSLLVGNDLLCMTTATEAFDGQMYHGDPTPVYWMDRIQEFRLEYLKETDGVIAPNMRIRPREERGQMSL